MILSACTAQQNGPASTADLERFCDRLPRPTNAGLDLHPVSNSWFEVYNVDPGVFAIYEPFQWQEVISYLILGESSALLFDTGNGIGDIKAIVDELTTLPVRVINSHSHFDHVGGNYQFSNILSVSTEFSIERSVGSRGYDIRAEVSAAALCKPLPADVVATSHQGRPYSITRRIEDGERIDLGGRTLELIWIPGHTDDSVALVDYDAGLLWSGDSFYVGPIWLFAPETDIAAYERAVDRLAALASKVRKVFPAHNTVVADPELLIKLRDYFADIKSGAAKAETTDHGQVEFRFAEFSFLLRDELLPEFRHDMSDAGTR